MTSKFEFDISEIVLGSKYNSSDLNFEGKLSELNIWDNYNINIDPEVCSHVKPEPNILKWSDVDNSTINGTKSKQARNIIFQFLRNFFCQQISTHSISKDVKRSIQSEISKPT